MNRANPRFRIDRNRGCARRAVIAFRSPVLPQTEHDGSATARSGRGKQPKTAWGDPDIQGMWPIINLISTPFQRPRIRRHAQIRRSPLPHRRRIREDAASASRPRQALQDEIKSNKMGMGHWAEASHHNDAARLTSLIVEPANGRFPELTERGKELEATMSSSWSGQAVFDRPTDFDTWDRCITRGLPPSMLPVQLQQRHPRSCSRRATSSIRLEMIHEARVIPDRRPAAARSGDQAMDGRVARSLGRQHARRRDDELQRPRRHDQRRHSGLAARRHADDDQHEDHGALHAHRRRHDGLLDARRGSRGAARARGPPAIRWSATTSYQFFEYACNEDNTAVRNYITTSRYERAQPDARDK